MKNANFAKCSPFPPNSGRHPSGDRAGVCDGCEQRNWRGAAAGGNWGHLPREEGGRAFLWLQPSYVCHSVLSARRRARTKAIYVPPSMVHFQAWCKSIVLHIAPGLRCGCTAVFAHGCRHPIVSKCISNAMLALLQITSHTAPPCAALRCTGVLPHRRGVGGGQDSLRHLHLSSKINNSYLVPYFIALAGVLPYRRGAGGGQDPH